MFPQGFISDIDLIGMTLLHFLWQGIAVGVLYLILRRLCASGTARYRLGLSMLLFLALCPLLTLAYLQASPADMAVGSQRAAIWLGTFNRAADHAVAGWQIKQFLPWCVAFWLAGVLLLAIRSLRQWARLLSVVRSATALPDDWKRRLHGLAERFDLRRPVRLLSSIAVPTPMLVGWIKPTILLPASMISGLAPDQLELVIAHELGHVRRWDYLVNLLQVVIETVLFYHPVVHWISRDVRNAREECCDDLVLDVTRGDRLVYARTLADLEQMRQELTVAAPALGLGGGILLNRVRRIVGVSEVLEPLPRNYVWPLIMALAALGCVVWRSQSRHPVAADVKTVLASAPARAMALVSGNANLSVRRPPVVSAPPDLPVRDHRPMHAALTVQSTLGPAATTKTIPNADQPVRIARPGVHLPAAGTPRFADLLSTVPLAARMPSVPAPPAGAMPAPPAIQPLHVVAPAYPATAMARGVEGSVELEFHVDVGGKVGRVRVLGSRPAGVFDAAAISALRQWRFPAAAASSAAYSQKFAFNLKQHGVGGNADDCQHVTGTLICRH